MQFITEQDRGVGVGVTGLPPVAGLGLVRLLAVEAAGL